MKYLNWKWKEMKPWQSLFFNPSLGGLFHSRSQSLVTLSANDILKQAALGMRMELYWNHLRNMRRAINRCDASSPSDFSQSLDFLVLSNTSLWLWNRLVKTMTVCACACLKSEYHNGVSTVMISFSGRPEKLRQRSFWSAPRTVTSAWTRSSAHTQRILLLFSANQIYQI